MRKNGTDNGLRPEGMHLINIGLAKE